MRLYEPSVLDQIVLALVTEKARHGFAVYKEIESDESLTTVIHVRRPLVYRSLKSLLEGKLIRETKTEPGDQGSPRVIYTSTARGKRASRNWLEDVVDHPRDARIALLAKFVLRSRLGLGNKTLAKRQRDVFIAQSKSLQQSARIATDNVRLIALWRVESINAIIRLLNAVINS